MRFWFSFLIALVSSAPIFAADADDPAAERASFKVADGFDVELFASEKEGVVKPIQMRFDAKGRLWVIQSTAYPQAEPGQTPNDKVLILEDTDHDGKVDKTTVFADGLYIPTGIEVTGDCKTAYVGNDTQLLRLTDTNGDGKADVRETVLRGFGTGDMHQCVNSFAWGPGGELWMCQGLSIRSRVETAYGIVSLSGAGLWRLDTQRMKLERFYGGAAEPQNPWGYVFTDFGEPIVIAGNNSSPIYPVPGLVSNRVEAPPKLIWQNGGGRKCSGGDIVGTDHFPKEWQGALILGGYINNAVWAVNINDDGSGFSLTDRPTPLITSTDTSFRPVDVKFGPDGALYLCDWCNPIIGHYQASFRDPRRDKTHGRIWRVTAKGRPLMKPPELMTATTPQLLDELKSTDRWTRQFAKRVLADRPKDDVVSALAKWTTQPGLTDLALKEALGVYQSQQSPEPALVNRLAKSPNRGARAYAAGVIGAWADRLTDPLTMLKPLAADEDARVRLQAVVASSFVNDPRAIETAMTAADSPTDPFIDYAIKQTVYALKPAWNEPFRAGKLAFDNKPNRIGALVRADGSPDTLAALRSLVASPTIDAATRETFLHLLADIGDANDLATILKLTDAPLQAKLLPALANAAELRNVRPAGDLVAAVNGMLASANEDVRAAGPLLAAEWKLDALKDPIDALSADAAQPLTVRRAAIHALPVLAGSGSRDRLMKFAADTSQPALRATAIAALSTFDLDAAAAAAADFLSAAAPDVEVHDLVQAILARTNGPAALAKAVESKKPAADAAKIALRTMSTAGVQDESLSKSLTSAAGITHEPRQLSEAQVAALAADVKANGDGAHGAQIFKRAELGCAVCHAVNGVGGHVGPDLGAVGTAQTTEFIIGAILIPNREVKEGYMSYLVQTKKGETIQAYILHDDPQELTIRDIAKDKEVQLRKDAINRTVQRGSVMPNGLADMLTAAEFRDLVKYLTERGRAGN